MTDTVATVVCCYRLSPDTVRGQLERLAKQAGVILAGVIIDNRPGSTAAIAGGWQVIPGSNDLMDFSAYREGAAHLLEQPVAPGCALFLNDTTFTEHNAALIVGRLLRYRKFVSDLDVPAIVGKTDRYSSVCFANPWSGIDAYISSYAFLLGRRAVPLLVEAYDRMDEEMGDCETDLSDPAWAPRLDRNFRAYLRLHLTTDYDPWSWYRLRQSPVDAATLRKKARCVYLEHRLSGAIGREGVIVSLFPRQRDQIAHKFAERWSKLVSARRLRT